MKTAYIKGKDSRNVIRYAVITEKSDGKFSISVTHPRMYSSASNFQIKRLANEVIKTNLIHEAIYQLVDSGVTNETKLVKILKEHTEDLKFTYLKMTREWSVKNFAFAVETNKRTHIEWLTAYDILEYPKNVDNVKNWLYSEEVKEYYKRNRLMEAHRSATNRIVKLGETGYILQQLALAEQHYEDSIIKLAYCLKEKGVDENTDLDITTGRVDVNFECTIKHNDKITRAYTIIASGEIQRPHYRYLVK